MGGDELMVKSRLWSRRTPGSVTYSIKDPTLDLLQAKSHVWAKSTHFGVVWKVLEGVSAQVSISSSDHGSQILDQSQNKSQKTHKGVCDTSIRYFAI
ncbi:hypothetical protein AVEN_224037-1 [Araneus ventricosus]|uniref:Uncharacterized protein n=1 Tax=Araneus ventricosus TaxID=182803 RepID=A0A4Y2J189_ARAVE|nr:hypothetical protein AVEN_224037-1 [Araneus ventricosus]